MADTEINVDVDPSDAKQLFAALPEDTRDGAKRAVRQLAVLAEGPMKKEAPEGSGRSEHLRETIDTRFFNGGLRSITKPRKRVGNERIPLIDILTDDPQWDPDNPPPIEPLRAWTRAKWGDGSDDDAYALQQSLVNNGMESAPNDFVNEAYQQWRTNVEDVAGEEVRELIERIN